ncbi:hypothetical protein [Streptomyces lydicus]|uniref:hypothetical protein n=1 Tax=Streptomyces lydicus TaxID=47763 RepID=UPI00379F648D
MPELARHGQAVEVRRGHLPPGRRPDAPAYGPKLRWSTPKLIAAANEQVPDVNLHTLRVLPPEPVQTGPATAAADPAPQSAAPLERQTPLAGYRRAPAHRSSRTPTTVTPVIQRRPSGRPASRHAN